MLALQVTNTLIIKGLKTRVREVVALCPMTAHPINIPEGYKDIYSSYEENAADVPLINKKGDGDAYRGRKV